jgi:uncharacterized protein (DUF1778 family)
MPKDVNLNIRVTVADRELIAAKAAEAGMSQSEYVVQAALGRRPGTGLSARVADLEARVRKLEEPGRGWIPS